MKRTRTLGAHSKHSPAGDGGFTLIEMLVVVAILGIIMVPLSGVIIGFLRNNDQMTATLAESHDVQIATAYWAQDVAAVGTRSTTSPYPLTQSIETGVASNAGLYPCGIAGTPSALVRFAFDDYLTPGASATLVRISYVVEAGSGQSELHRIRCAGSTVPASDTVIAHDLMTGVPPAVACSSSCTAAPAVPAMVTLTLTLKDPFDRGSASYVVTLTGQRRQS